MTVREHTDGRFMVDFRYETPTGRARHREVCPVAGKRAAQDFEIRRRRELEEGAAQPQEVQREVPTLAEFSETFMRLYAATQNKPSEITSKRVHFRYHILPELGALRLDAIGVLEIDRLKAAVLAKDVKAKTVNNCLTVLSKLLRYAEEGGVIVKAPRVRLMKAPLPEVDFLDFEEAERFLAEAERHGQWFSMLHTAIKTGLRFGELVELRWDDVDLVAGKLRVARSYYKGHIGTPKSGKPREVPLSERAVRVLKAHRHLRGELVFTKPDGSRIDDTTADDAIKRCCKRAGLRRIGWHVCRHTFASHLVMRGVPLKTIQELLGHSSLQMVLRYAHLTPQVKRDAVALLDAPAPGLGNGMGNGEKIAAKAAG